MSEHEILDRLRKSTWEDVDYFSNKNKPMRERFIVSELLTALSISHKEEELQSDRQASKIDVRFRQAAFQVKELPDPDLRRGQMYKDAYNSVMAATRLTDVAL